MYDSSISYILDSINGQHKWTAISETSKRTVNMRPAHNPRDNDRRRQRRDIKVEVAREVDVAMEIKHRAKTTSFTRRNVAPSAPRYHPERLRTTKRTKPYRLIADIQRQVLRT